MKMRKTARPANDLPRRPAADEFIKKNREFIKKNRRDNHTEIPWAAIVFMALMLAPSAATADPLVTLSAPPFALPVLPPVSRTWTGIVGVGGGYKTDVYGTQRSMLS